MENFFFCAKQITKKFSLFDFVLSTAYTHNHPANNLLDIAPVICFRPFSSPFPSPFKQNFRIITHFRVNEKDNC